MIRFAFYGRVSTEDQQDPESSRGWQLTRSRALIDARDGVIVTEFFDVDKSRSIPWQRRPQATALLAELKNPNREFDAVVVGEPHRAFYGNQYGLTFPLFEHYGVPLWVPEVGGPIDPRNEAHDLVMSVFGGMSKGERNRIKIRVKAAMGAQAKDEGRFLGGRPPYGYLIADAGPHPNPAKAADGKRLHKLDLDPEAAPVVRRIFAEFIAGHGFYAIAEGLTRDGIPSPSAHDPERNKHRSGIAWNKFAVRSILINPRYTGHQVWNKQRKDEVLIDVEDVALGHTTKLRWNETGKWLWSDKIVHPPIIDRDDLRPGAGDGRGPRARARRAQAAPLAAPVRAARLRLVRRLRAADAKPLGPRRALLPVPVPRRVRARQPRPAPPERLPARRPAHRRGRPLAGPRVRPAPPARDDPRPGRRPARRAAAPPGRRPRGNRAQDRRVRPQAQPSTAPPSTRAQAPPRSPRGSPRPKQKRPDTWPPGARAAPRRRRMSEAEIKAIVDRLADLARVLADADPNDKSEIFRQLGLRLTYHPGRGLVEAQVMPAECGFFESVRGGT